MRHSKIELDEELGIPICYIKFFKPKNQEIDDFKITIQVAKSKWNKTITKASWDQDKRKCTEKQFNEIKSSIQKICSASCTSTKGQKASIEVQGSHIENVKKFFMNYFNIDENHIFIQKPRIKFHPSFFINIKQNDDDIIEVSWKNVFSPKNFFVIFENLINSDLKTKFDKKLIGKSTHFFLKDISKDKIIHYFNENFKMETYQILDGLENENDIQPEIALISDDPYNQMINQFSNDDENSYYKKMSSTIVDLYNFEKEKYSKSAIKENLHFVKIGRKNRRYNVWRTKFDATKVFSIDRIETGKLIKEIDGVSIQYKNQKNKIQGRINDVTNGIVTVLIDLQINEVPPGYVDKNVDKQKVKDKEEEEEEADEYEEEKPEKFSNKKQKEDQKQEFVNSSDDDYIEDIENQAGDYCIKIIPSNINYQRSAMALLTLKDMNSSPIQPIIEGKIDMNEYNKEKEEDTKIESFSINLKDSKYLSNENRNNEKFMKYLEIKPHKSQINCINMIMNNPISLIQGPPGCGKTASIGLFVYHLLTHRNEDQSTDEKKRILLCAFSNQAVENIVKFVSPIVQALGKNLVWIVRNSKTFENKTDFENASDEEKNLVIYKIMQRQTSEAHIFQIYQQEKWDHNKKVKLLLSNAKSTNNTQVNSNKLPKFPHEKTKEMIRILNLCEKNMISDADVVCCTLFASAKETMIGLHFDTVIIDEASQANESTSIIPLIHRPSKLIMLGDHKQLDIYVDEKIRKIHPQTTNSLYYKLISNRMKSEMLNIQFRMHPLIAEFPNQEFYDGLITNAEGILERTATNLNSIPTPIIFIDVENGKERRMNKEKSFFNYEEANEVEKIVNNLKFNGINGNEIGVITPYFAQANIIRKKVSNFNGIKVSSVDNFQGSERDFIILSLVRTNEESNFGFVSDEKRLNVALTRARKGLIIIGNYDSIESSLHEKNCFLRDLCHFYENKLAVVKYNDIKKLNNTVTSNQLITNQHT